MRWLAAEREPARARGRGDRSESRSGFVTVTDARACLRREGCVEPALSVPVPSPVPVLVPVLPEPECEWRAVERSDSRGVNVAAAAAAAAEGEAAGT